MKYVLLVYVDPSRKVPENNAELTENWVNGMDSRGIRLIGSELRPVEETTTVTVLNGKLALSDGPFAETKEHIAGFDIIECNNLDEAIAVAAQHPVALFGHIEVRSFWVR